jgi:hypothetical protein
LFIEQGILNEMLRPFHTGRAAASEGKLGLEKGGFHLVGFEKGDGQKGDVFQLVHLLFFLAKILTVSVIRDVVFVLETEYRQGRPFKTGVIVKMEDGKGV